jgi:hypothetical protein
MLGEKDQDSLVAGEILTRKQYEAKKKLPIPERKKKPAGDSMPTAESAPAGSIIKEYILQDPDLKTYIDIIKIGDREFNRDCYKGSLHTQEKVLCDFLIGKGYILIDTVEVVNV